MTPTDVLMLPTPLILLVHLHILEYPHANNPEYDHQIFNPRTRGLRERAKVMEDVAYFLVGRVEGKSVKSILSTYPCMQPSETLAFRTSLTKYLETLRHQCIYPASNRPSAKSNLKSLSDSQAADAESVASWWKDVVVRKSLLEECSGDKFERLIVSLSTHALMKASRSIPPDKMSSLLRNQPVAYSTALAVYQAKRHAWSKAASRLMRLEQDLTILRNSLNEVTTSKYQTLTTRKLQALAESKLQTLLQRFWAGDESKSVFAFLVELAGIRSSRTPFSIMDVEISAVSKPAGLPSPLPIVAAHHLSHLKRLRRPIFQPKSKLEGGATIKTVSRPHAEIILAEQLDSEKHMRQTLVDAISRMKRIGSEMNAELRTLILHTPAVPSKLLWTPPSSSMIPIDFDPVPEKELLISLGFNAEYEALDAEDTLEMKIERIRNSVLPSYPAIPDQSAPRKLPLNARQAEGKSKIPQTSRYQHTRLIAESTSSSLLKAPNADGPATPLMSPSKSSRSIRRKSVRFSMGQKRTERASMFRVFSGGLEDEVDRLVDETNDFPTDDEETDDEDFGVSAFKTPKSKVRPTTNRIWTAGTPVQGRRNGPGKGTPKPRVPSALTRMLDMGPSVSLPTIPSSSSAAFEGAGDELDGQRGWGMGDVDATPRPVKKDLPRQLDSSDMEDCEDEDVFDDDPPSMTLKDILLSADTSHFDLLEASTEEIEAEMLVEDTSFVWEWSI